MKMKSSMKKAIKRFESKNSFIWLANEYCQPMYMILWYNGVNICRVSENDNVVKVEFFASKRQAKKIRRDMRGFEIRYKAVAWAC